MNQRPWDCGNHSRALCGEIKSRTLLHLPASCLVCVTVGSLTPEKQDYTLLSWRENPHMSARWLTPPCSRRDGFGSVLYIQGRGDARHRQQHVGIKSPIINKGNVQKCLTQDMWCLTSWAHNHVRADGKMENVPSHGLWHLDLVLPLRSHSIWCLLLCVRKILTYLWVHFFL